MHAKYRKRTTPIINRREQRSGTALVIVTASPYE